MDDRKPGRALRDRAEFAGVYVGCLIAFALFGLVAVVAGYLGVDWFAHWIAAKSGGLGPITLGIGMVLLGSFLAIALFRRRSAREVTLRQKIVTVVFALMSIIVGGLMANYGLGTL